MTTVGTITITARQRDALLTLVHEAYCRGYDSGHHDASGEDGLPPRKTRFAPWTVAEVWARAVEILKEEVPS